MLRWLWKMRSDRGGQHAEAGVLMATMILLAGAVVVGSVPQLGTVVADQWVCHIGDPGSERCGGDVNGGVTSTEPNRSGSTNDVSVKSIAGDTDEVSGEPALSHWPLSLGNSGEGGQWYVDDLGIETMDSCAFSGSVWSCTGGEGTFYECAISSNISSGIDLVQINTCSPTITSATTLVCGDEGLSPGYDTCLGPEDVVLHCTNADASGDRSCTDSDHDADTEPPGDVLVSCGPTSGYSATCLGDNGTLYRCPTVGAAGGCQDGARNLSPADPSLTDCVPIVSHGDTTGAVVRCTYTPEACDVATGEEGGCDSEAVSVRCMVDGPETSGGTEYQHCQSLGQIVPAGSTMTTACIVGGTGTCVFSASVIQSSPPDIDVMATADLGPIQVEIADDYNTELSIPTGETDENGDTVRRDMSHQELTAFCQTNAQQCEAVASATQAKAKRAYGELLQHLGLCDDAAGCAATYDAMKLAASGGSQAGRKLKGLPLTSVQMTGLGLFGAAGLTGYSSNYIENEHVKTGVQTVAMSMAFLGTLLFGMDAYRGNLAAQAQAGINADQAAQIDALEAGRRAAEIEMAHQVQVASDNYARQGETLGTLVDHVARLSEPTTWREFLRLIGRG